MSDMNEMACQELVEVVTEYLEGTLDPVDRQRFEEHLAVCHGCRNYLDQLRTMIRLTGALRADTISPEMRTQLLDAFRAWKHGSSERRLSPDVRPVSATCACHRCS